MQARPAIMHILGGFLAIALKLIFILGTLYFVAKGESTIMEKNQSRNAIFCKNRASIVSGF